MTSPSRMPLAALCALLRDGVASVPANDLNKQHGAAVRRTHGSDASELTRKIGVKTCVENTAG